MARKKRGSVEAAGDSGQDIRPVDSLEAFVKPTRLTGRELADRLREERRVARIKQKGY